MMYDAHVAALLEAWNEGNLDGLDAHLDPNTIRRGPPSASSDANNLEELKQVITDFRTTFPDAKVTIDEIHFQEGRSFARWTFTGTNTGPGDFPPTGKPVEFKGSSFGHYAGGKLVEEHVYFDGFDMMSQLGLVPDPSAAG
jgi:predicted ester cyclase